MTPEERMLREIFGQTNPEEPAPRPPANTTPLFQLAAVMPEFCDELTQSLAAQGESGLAASVADLWVFDRCRCEAAYCATIYTRPVPKAGFKEKGGLSVLLNDGPVHLDTEEGMLACIEVLDQPEIRRKLVASLP